MLTDLNFLINKKKIVPVKIGFNYVSLAFFKTKRRPIKFTVCRDKKKRLQMWIWKVVFIMSWFFIYFFVR